MSNPYEGQITIDAKLLHALWSYGAVQTVEGVIYQPGSHQECLAIVDRMFRDRAKGLNYPAPTAGSAIVCLDKQVKFAEDWSAEPTVREMVTEYYREHLDEVSVEEVVQSYLDGVSPSAAMTDDAAEQLVIAHLDLDRLGVIRDDEDRELSLSERIAELSRTTATSAEPAAWRST